MDTTRHQQLFTYTSSVRPDAEDLTSSNSISDHRIMESLMIDPSLTSSPTPSPPPIMPTSSSCTTSLNNNINSNQQLNNNQNNHIVYRLALTGGPCSGKTTGQARISTFFENLGWKVYRVPETATTLFSGGIRFPDLSQEEQERFQENLIKVMISIERTFFSLAQTCKRNCLIICDRGVMDATAYMSGECWQRFLRSNNWNTIELRDNRYNQVIHLVTSADGAEEYYNVEGNPVRTEGIQLARELDRKTMEAWVGHPYMDVIDNSTDFDNKMRRMISALCRRIGIEASDRLQDESHKIKFLVNKCPTDLSVFPPYQDFDVVHDYLITSNPKIQSRIRKRGQNGNWSYQQTVRRSDAGSQMIELRRQISHRDYVTLLSQRDDNHHTIYKTRRCFLWQQTYFQMDVYQAPRNGLILLEAYTTLSGEALKAKLPTFLDIVREVTDDPEFSMWELSKRVPKSSTLCMHTPLASPSQAASSSDDEKSSNSSSSSNSSVGPSRRRKSRKSIAEIEFPAPLPRTSTNGKQVSIGESTNNTPNEDNNNNIKTKSPSVVANGHAGSIH